MATNRHEKRKAERIYTYGRRGRRAGSKKGYHAGSFGKSTAEKKGYTPLRFNEDFTIDERYL